MWADIAVRAFKVVVCSMLVLSSVSFCLSTLVPAVNPAVEAENRAVKSLSAIVPPDSGHKNSTLISQRAVIFICVVVHFRRAHKKHLVF